MFQYVFGLPDIDKTNRQTAGGKAANLGELSRIAGIRVPDGFCISSKAYESIIAENASLNELIVRLSLLKTNDREQITGLSGEIRAAIEGTHIPANLSEEIIRHLSAMGEKDAYAIRSSATAEDLPTASFAGQQDTYLNIIGKEAILQHISRCWASLFTVRAVIYRFQRDIDHRRVRMAVIVQKMVFPLAAGILFTADPVSSNRKVLSIDAGFGLGEALVSGLVSPDSYKVRNGAIIDKKIPAKKLAIHPGNDGGTQTQEIGTGQQHKQVLTDEQILRLEHMGRRIERHFGHPQDIEWCLLADNQFYFVQSRPITTLFPIPEAKDGKDRIYVSVGHQQMMTDAMKPLGISFWQMTAARPMTTAGGRLFVDITENLASPAGRNILINVLGKSDPLIKDALQTITKGDLGLPPEEDEPKVPLPDFQTIKDYDPAIVRELIGRSETAIDLLKKNIRAKSGADLFDLILEDIRQLKTFLTDPQSFGVIMTAMNATSWVNEKMQEWLGEKNAADTLSQSAPDNITSEMGLALLDVADVIRPYPEVIHSLRQAKGDNFPDRLFELDGGRESHDAIQAFLDRYGMRCVGEIDITRTRWSEKPSVIFPMILNNIKNFEPNAGQRKFEQGRQEALKKQEELLTRLASLPGGQQKAEETRRMIALIRNFIGYREYPKYAIVSRYYIYKQALKEEAQKLVKAGAIPEKEDIFYLSFEEVREAVRTQQPDQRLIRERKAAFESYQRLTPPRVITSNGEIVAGAYKREDLPAGAIAGLPVSAGVIEGRARVILDLKDAFFEEGDLLITAYTDPSWTPAFVSIRGLVTEVGGLMTHGAVIAREYGLPAVVGVENATRLIKDGQRIRVNGTEGYIEIL